MGLLLVFALSWAIDLAAAADSRGLLPFHAPFVLRLLVGYAIIAGTVLAAALTGGGAGVRALLRRYVQWRASHAMGHGDA